ncbi:response regulator [Pendulispora rubella]|uniref:Response regulator n=1 Tax=Pendulispora rubella TaxID=2741070 RepID=A0ABZ2KZC0_9BACT
MVSVSPFVVASSPRILVVDDSPTLRKVVASILERNGYTAYTAPDGEAALAALANGACDPELVLVDFVMPRMNGLAFCREMRKRFPDRKIGVVLMSAKADRIRESFLQQAGALDAISKPFDPQALLLVVDNVLRKVEHAPAPGATTETEIAPPSILQPPSEPPQTAAAGEGKVILSGDLSLPIGAVLQLLQMENQTGVLVVEGEVRATDATRTTTRRTIVITLREGLIDLVQSRTGPGARTPQAGRGAGDEFRLGRYFVEAGLVTPEELEEVQATRGENGTKLLGDLLVESRKISLGDLRAALIRQSSELVYEALRWQCGHFEFRRRPPPSLAAASRLGLPAAQVVMEGFRRVDEWRVIEARVGRFDEVLVRDPVAIAALGEGRLVKSERAILDAIDGRRTIGEIVSAAHMSSFEGCRILFQLIEARLVRRRPAS